MASSSLASYVAVVLAVACTLLQLANAQEPTPKLDTSLSIGFATIMVSVLALTIVVTMCLALGS